MAMPDWTVEVWSIIIAALSPRQVGPVRPFIAADKIALRSPSVDSLSTPPSKESTCRGPTRSPYKSRTSVRALPAIYS